MHWPAYANVLTIASHRKDIIQEAGKDLTHMAIPSMLVGHTEHEQGPSASARGLAAKPGLILNGTWG